jgi:hypothetical protein
MKAMKIVVLVGLTLAVGALGSRLFRHKVLQDNSARNACISNLRQIAGAKGIAAQELGLSAGALVRTQSLVLYMEGGWRDCPSGGAYTVNPVGKDPTCNIPGHSLAQ